METPARRAIASISPNSSRAQNREVGGAGAGIFNRQERDIENELSDTSEQRAFYLIDEYIGRFDSKATRDRHARAEQSGGRQEAAVSARARHSSGETMDRTDVAKANQLLVELKEFDTHPVCVATTPNIRLEVLRSWSTIYVDGRPIIPAAVRARM